MSYVKQNFTDGSVLTAAQLNHMEEGIFVAHENDKAIHVIGRNDDNGRVVNYTALEIYERLQDDGGACHVYLNMSGWIIPLTSISENKAVFEEFVYREPDFDVEESFYLARWYFGNDKVLHLDEYNIPLAGGGSGGTAVWLTDVALPASAWTGEDSLYSQVVTIDGITEYSKVDLLPSVEQLAIFHTKDVAFVTENEDGVVTVYAIGDKPLLDYTMQAQITEVQV